MGFWATALTDTAARGEGPGRLERYDGKLIMITKTCMGYTKNIPSILDLASSRHVLAFRHQAHAPRSWNHLARDNRQDGSLWGPQAGSRPVEGTTPARSSRVLCLESLDKSLLPVVKLASKHQPKPAEEYIESVDGSMRKGECPSWEGAKAT